MSYPIPNQPQQRGYFPVNSGPHSPAASSSSLLQPNSVPSSRGPPSGTFYPTPPIRPGSPGTLSSPVHAAFSRPPSDYSQAGASAFVRTSYLGRAPLYRNDLILCSAHSLATSERTKGGCLRFRGPQHVSVQQGKVIFGTRRTAVLSMDSSAHPHHYLSSSCCLLTQRYGALPRAQTFQKTMTTCIIRTRGETKISTRWGPYSLREGLLILDVWRSFSLVFWVFCAFLPYPVLD